MNNDKACPGQRGTNMMMVYILELSISRGTAEDVTQQNVPGGHKMGRGKRYISKYSVIHCAVPRLVPAIQYNEDEITSRGVRLKMHIVS